MVNNPGAKDKTNESEEKGKSYKGKTIMVCMTAACLVMDSL